MLIGFHLIEDEKISLDKLQEEITEFEDYVQSSDVATMQSKHLAATYNHLLMNFNRTLDQLIAVSFLLHSCSLYGTHWIKEEIFPTALEFESLQNP